MEILLILLVVAVIATTTRYGYKKGLIKIALSVCISVISLFGSFLLSSPMRNFIRYNTNIEKNIYSQMKVYVDTNMDSRLDSETLTKDAQDEAIKQLQLPKVIEEQLLKSDKDILKEGIKASRLNENIARALTNMIMQVICFAITFLIFKVGVRVLMQTLGILSRLPVIKDVNRMLGGALGFAEGMIIVWILCIVVTALGGIPMGQDILSTIKGNALLSFIYNSNILLKILLIFK